MGQNDNEYHGYEGPQAQYFQDNVARLLEQWPNQELPDGWVPVQYIVSCCCGNSTHASLVRDDYMRVVIEFGFLIGDDGNGHLGFLDNEIMQIENDEESLCCCSTLDWLDETASVVLFQRIDGKLVVEVWDGRGDDVHTTVCDGYDEAKSAVEKGVALLKKLWPEGHLPESGSREGFFPCALDE